MRWDRRTEGNGGDNDAHTRGVAVGGVGQDINASGVALGIRSCELTVKRKHEGKEKEDKKLLV